MQSNTFFILFGTVISTLEVELLMAEREREGGGEGEGEREQERELRETILATWMAYCKGSTAAWPMALSIQFSWSQHILPATGTLHIVCSQNIIIFILMIPIIHACDQL